MQALSTVALFNLSELGGLIPIRIRNDNYVASLCLATALSAASRLVLISNANWNESLLKFLQVRIQSPRRHPRIR
jgi:hypothetical protein